MSGTDHQLVSEHVPVADRVRTTRRWAVGVLALATVVLVGYLAMVVVAVWLVGSAVEAVSGRDLGELDVTGLLTEAAPGLIVGWGAGLLAAAALGRGDALGARSAGIAAGSLGAVVGAALLAATGVL